MSAWQRLVALRRRPPPAAVAPPRRVALDPAALAAGGLHETPAGWRARLDGLGLDAAARAELARLSGPAALPEALRDVVGARRDSVWRRLAPRWFLAGALLTGVAGLAVGWGSREPVLGVLLAAQYGTLTGFLALLFGRWRYDRLRKRILAAHEPALAATDAPLGGGWVDALKALAVAPAVVRCGGLLLDGTAPARASLAAWAATLRGLAARCATWEEELAAGEAMVAELGGLAGARGREAGEDLAARRRQVAALAGEVAALEEAVALATRDLGALVEAVQARPAPSNEGRDLRALYALLGRVRDQGAALEALLDRAPPGAG